MFKVIIDGYTEHTNEMKTEGKRTFALHRSALSTLIERNFYAGFGQ